MATVTRLLQDVGASIDQDTDLPDGTELTVRVQFADISQRDWSDAYVWDQLRVTYKPAVNLSMTSIGLPSNYSRMMSPVYDYSGGIGTPYVYRELNSPSDRFSLDPNTKYMYVSGDDSRGYSIQISPALSSGASIVFDYYSAPSSLATLSDTITCPSLSYMKKRVEYYILQSRSDARFPTVKAESDTLLSQLIEDQDTPQGSKINRVPDWMRSNNYIPGVD